MTFLTRLHHKCLGGEQLSLPISLSNMNNKHYGSPVPSDIFVGSGGLPGTGSSVVYSLIIYNFLVFFSLPRERKKYDFVLISKCSSCNG